VFFGVAEDVSEPTLLQLFSRHGDVTGLFLVRSALGLPSGCGYVTMAIAEQAAAALAALQGSSECAEAGGKLGLLIVQLPAQDSQQPQSPQQQQKQHETTANAPVKDVRMVSRMHCTPDMRSLQDIHVGWLQQHACGTCSILADCASICC
jgi:RNA recognition motif-containing protein